MSSLILGRSSTSARQQNARGFTLFELAVVLVVIAIVAAIALPRFIGMSQDARIAAVKAGVGVVATASSLANARCHLTDGCDDSTHTSKYVLGPGDISHTMLYGYPTGQSVPNGFYGIADWVQMDGFTVIQSAYGSTAYTLFTKDGAPDPLHCAVQYKQSNVITALTGGC